MSTPAIKSKLPHVGTTIFTVMSGLANQHNAINLGQGFPDYQMNEDLMNKVSEVMQKGWNQYVPMQGYLPLRESIAEKIGYLYNTKISADSQITITPGGTYAIYTALTTVLQPGDEVIIFEPAYDSYIPNVEINGAVPVLIDLKFPGYKIDWNEVRRKVSSKTKVIMVNSPHNPTGAVLMEDDINQLRDIVKETNIFIFFSAKTVTGKLVINDANCGIRIFLPQQLCIEPIPDTALSCQYIWNCRGLSYSTAHIERACLAGRQINNASFYSFAVSGILFNFCL